MIVNELKNYETEEEGVIVELRTKSQITLPKKLLRQVGMERGDKFEAVVVNGQIHLIPVVIYPKAVVERLEKELEKAEKDYKSGKIKTYDNIEEMMEDLERKMGR